MKLASLPFLLFINLSVLSLAGSLFSQSAIPSLYVGEITPRDNESSSLSPRIRSQVVISVLNTQKNKYNILDDELVKQLSLKVARLQKQGCDDTECRRALDLAIDWDEKIVGEIQKEGDRFSLILKIYRMDKDTYQPGIRNSLYKKFHSYQLDFFVKEMSRSLMDSSYAPDYSLAPKKEGEEVEDRIGLNVDKVFWGNVFFPGYNRIARDDSSGYVLGSVWSLSLLGFLATYPKYTGANANNATWSANTLLYPSIMPSGMEAMGGIYAVGQMDSTYNEAYSQGQILNGFGLISIGVWSYSWFYKGESSLSGSSKIPDSGWTWDFQMKRQAERGFMDNQYVLQFTGRIE